MTEWFEEWFGEEYLHLYPHRNERDAHRLIALICRVLPWRAGWRVLDVACGAGRHLVALEEAGAVPFGFDLSGPLLARARRATDRPLVRADMRALPFRPRSMDLAVNLFTSFGYFAADEEHTDALGQMLATVRPGGWFVIDFLNAEQVRAALVPAESTSLGGVSVEIHRAISADGRFVHKSIRLDSGKHFEERVRLLGPTDLERMLASHGAAVQGRFGDYQGGPLDGGTRTILTARVAQ
ncbi:MAG TPA: class I SAM-dependent methyltransferase [Gemmatimonadales bacterium]|nr:class I SAM-dependent methyltransferase [Gemmatimonadales bacterium]